MSPQGEGTVSLWRHKSEEAEERIGVLVRLFVVREARKHAVGERLMRAAMDDAKQSSIRLVLDVMTKDTAAIRLYERLGWRYIGEVSHSALFSKSPLCATSGRLLEAFEEVKARRADSP
jgi:ribosomal protein S18 acetylase RimI-like enzyme